MGSEDIAFMRRAPILVYMSNVKQNSDELPPAGTPQSPGPGVARMWRSGLKNVIRSWNGETGETEVASALIPQGDTQPSALEPTVSHPDQQPAEQTPPSISRAERSDLDDAYDAARNLLYWYRRYGPRLADGPAFGRNRDIRKLSSHRLRIPPEVGRRFDAHGFKETGSEVTGIRTLLAEGIDQARDFHTVPLRSTDSEELMLGAANGAAGPFTDGFFILASPLDQPLVIREADGHRRLNVGAVIVDHAVFALERGSQARDALLQHLAGFDIFKPADIDRLRNAPSVVELLRHEFPGIRFIDSAELADPENPGGPLADMVAAVGQ